MEELPVEDPGHMASANRQLHDWERFIMGKRLTDETSGGNVRLPFPPLPAPFPFPNVRLFSVPLLSFLTALSVA